MKKERLLHLTSTLKEMGRIEFKYKNLFYEIFESTEEGYVINIYFSNNKDEDDEYLEKNLFDGGIYIGSPKDAIKFML